MIAATTSLLFALLASTPVSAPIELANRSLSRRIEFSPWLRTTLLENRLNGHRYPVDSEEFALRVEGLAEPLRSRDFSVIGLPEFTRLEKSQTLTVHLRHPPSGIEVEVHYRLDADAFWMEKKLSVRSSERRIDDIDVERLRFDLLRPAPTSEPPPLGRPLFLGGELFLGLAWPSGHNRIEKDGRIVLRHFPGRKGSLVTKTAILGVASDQINDRARDRFFAYLARVRARPVQRFTLWDTYHNDDDEFVRERFNVARDLFAKRGVPIDAVVMDGGWTEPKSVMRVSRERPGRPALVAELAEKQLASRLGLHVITSGVRATVDHAWLAERYDMLNPVAYCLADDRVAGELKRNLLEHVRAYNVSALKFDWANFNCDRGQHSGHREGLDYGREAITEAYADLLISLRRERPGIYLYDAGWDSPWWLLFEDAVFSGEGDYNTTLAGPPSASTNDLETTWRDGVLSRLFRDQDVPFPLSSLMNHGPVNWGWDNWFNKPGNPLDRFSDELIMNYMRGTQLIEFCLNLSALGDKQRDALAAVARWASANDDVLLADSRFILGDPRKGEIYGYSHFSADGRGLLGVRNPVIQPGQAKLVLDEHVGMRADAGPCWVSVVYPYLFTQPAALRYGDTLELPVDAWETLVVSVLPASALSSALPLGVRYEIASRSDAMIGIRVLLSGANPASISWTDGVVRAGLAADSPTSLSAISLPVDVNEVALRRSGATNLKASFRVDRPRSAEARLFAIQYLDGLAEQPLIQFELRSNGRTLDFTRHVNSSRALDRTDTRGWIMADAGLPSAATVEVNVQASPDEKLAAFLKSLPFECGSRCDSVATNARAFELWLVSDLALAPGPLFEIGILPSKQRLPDGLPDFGLRRERRARLLGRVEAGVAGPTLPTEVFAMGTGAKPWGDRDYRVSLLPRELTGLPTIRLSHERLKTDSSLPLQAHVPLRVYAAFGALRGNDQWLDPQPGWRPFEKGKLGIGIPDVPGEIYYADFPAGAVTLFEGLNGNWVLLGITAAAGAP